MRRGDSLGGRLIVTAVAAVAAAFLLFVPAGASAAPAPADLDRSFGAGGGVRVLADTPLDRPGYSFLSGEDMVVGPGDEIYVLVSVLSCQALPCQTRLVVERFLPDGAIDTGFGVRGVSAGVAIPMPEPNRAPYALALSADGRPVVAFPSGGDVVLVRFDADGRLDATFGSGGTVVADFGGYEADPKLAVQPDGAVVLAAESESATGRAVVVARYRADGSFDPGFGGSGLVALRTGPLGGFTAVGGGGALLGLPGCCPPVAKAVRLGLLSAGGALERGLSISRWGRVQLGAPATMSDLLALRKGRLMLVGVAGKASFAARLHADGRPDRGFGRAGIVRMSSIPQRSVGPQAAVDGRGRLVVVGSAAAEEPFSNDVYVLRRGADGRPDRSFGGGRAVLLGYYLREPLALGMQSGQRPLLFAESGDCVRTCYNRAPVLLRLVGGSSATRCAGGRATIVGTREQDRLIGTRGNDVIAALGGRDAVYGRGGDDLICGGAERDELFGGPGRDRLLQ